MSFVLKDVIPRRCLLHSLITAGHHSYGKVMFLLVSVFYFVRAATEALTIGKRMVRILLECLIVLAQLLVKHIHLTIAASFI